MPARRLRHAGARRHAAADRDARDQDRSPSIRRSPSPFASALLFGYVANYIYDGDAPLAERRAQALAIDQAQLRELLGEAELRELLDADALARGRAPAAAPRATRSGRETIDGVHDLLLRLGDLTADEIAARSRIDAAAALAELVRARRADRRQHRRRAARSSRSNTPAAIATRSACRCRPGLPESLLAAVAERRARPRAAVRAHARAVHDRRVRRAATASAARPRKRCSRSSPSAGRLLEGEFRPGGTGPRVVRSATCCSRSAAGRWRSCASRSSRSIRRSSAGCSRSWQGVVRRRAGLDALLDAIENLQGAPLAGVDLRERDPRGAHRALQPGRPRRADRRRRSRLVRRRAARRARRPARALSRPITSRACGGRRPLGRSRRRASAAIVDAPRAITARRSSPTLHEAAGRRLPGRDRRRALGSGVEGRDHQRHLPRPARVHAPARSGGARKPAATGRALPQPPASRRPSAEGRWSLVSERAGAGGVADRVVDRHRAAAAGALRRAHPRGRRRRRHQRRLRRGLRRAQGAWRTPDASAAAISSPASARRSSRCRRRSICCARCAVLPDEPEVVVLAATDPANPYGTILNGRRRRRRTTPAAAGRRAPSARSSSS